MHDLPRRKLIELIHKYGASVCDDPRRCEALLRDYCGGYKREIHVLVNAVRERVPADLLTSHTQTRYEVQSARLTKRLRDNLGLAEDAAKWAVESWATALGIAADAQQDSGAVNHKSSSERIRRSEKTKTAAADQQPRSSLQKTIGNAEERLEFAGVRVTDTRASSGFTAESRIASDNSPPISDVTLSSAARPRLTGAAWLIFLGLLALAGILIVAGVLVAVPEMLRGDDPDETTLYVWIPAIFLLSLSLVGLLPGFRLRTFLFLSTAFFVSGAVVVVASEYVFKSYSGAPYWALLATVTGPFSIGGVLLGFAILKFIPRKQSRIEAKGVNRG